MACHKTVTPVITDTKNVTAMSAFSKLRQISQQVSSGAGSSCSYESRDLRLGISTPVLVLLCPMTFTEILNLMSSLHRSPDISHFLLQLVEALDTKTVHGAQTCYNTTKRSARVHAVGSCAAQVVQAVH